MVYVAPYILTKMDISAIRKADNLAIHLNVNENVQRVRAIKHCEKSNGRMLPQDIEHYIAAPVSLRTNWRQEAGPNVICFSFLWLYQSQKTAVTSILNTLRAGDGVKFVFHADYHSSQNVDETGLHADTLILQVYRAEKLHAQFELETSICPDNTARMVKGVRTKVTEVAS